MRRNPDLLAVLAIALYVWAGSVHASATPEHRPISSFTGVQIREALKAEARDAVRELVLSLTTFH